MTKGTLEKHTRDADTNNPPASKEYASSLFAVCFGRRSISSFLVRIG